MKKSIMGILAAAGLFAMEAQAQDYAPRNLSVTAVGETQLDATWAHPNAPYDSIEYDVEAEPYGEGNTPANHSVTGTSFSFTGLTPGTDYRVRIHSQPQGQGSRGATAVADQRTGGSRPYPPDAPPAICTFEDGTLTVSWLAVRYATSYESYLRSEARGTGAQTSLGSGTATERTYSGELQSGTTYFVDVRAINSGATATARNSEWGTCSFTIPDPETPGPTTPDPETPGPTTPTTPETPRVCTYEHRLNTVPGTTDAYTGRIWITSRVSGSSVRIRAYEFSDGSTLDVLDADGERVGSTTTLGSANSRGLFRVEDARGWHSVVVSHGVTVNGMNGVTVSMLLRGPSGAQVVPAHVVERCAPTTTTTTTQ